jgi:hypothetical protein
MMQVISKMEKTLVVVIGKDRVVLRNDIEKWLDIMKVEGYDVVFTEHLSNSQEIVQILINYDYEPLYTDIIFVTSDKSSSQWFIENKYNEKVLLNGINWFDVNTIPSLLERQRRNMSEHANF